MRFPSAHSPQSATVPYQRVLRADDASWPLSITREARRLGSESRGSQGPLTARGERRGRGDSEATFVRLGEVRHVNEAGVGLKPLKPLPL